MVIWITGLAGSGKTTLAKSLYTLLKKSHSNLVLLDGDVLRSLHNNDLQYTVEERLKTAWRICKLAQFLNNQEIHVICATISAFPEIQEWNRQNLNGYFEIYLKVDMDTLIQRDKKNLYSKGLKGEIKNVVGIDIPFHDPKKPHLTLQNENSISIEESLKTIIENLPKITTNQEVTLK